MTIRIFKIYTIAVIGFGYWGPNIVRNFYNHEDCTISYICDLGENARNRAKKQYPDIPVIDEPDIIFSDNLVDIVAIITPVSTHYSLAKKALSSGKHVFIEKPMVQTVEESNDLIRIAQDKNLIGVVDHTFLFTSAIIKIKEIIDSGDIGDILYFDSVRVNLGMFQHDVDVIWDLAPHDLSILFYLLNKKPVSITANGVDHLDNNLVDVAYLTLHYDYKMIANFHINWLSPVKVRKILIGGTKKMIVYDDLEPSEKIKIYDKGIYLNRPEDIHQLLIEYRFGDMVTPAIKNTEALFLEINEFINCIKNKNYSPINSLYEGKRIVEILSAAKQSLNTSNSKISL